MRTRSSYATQEEAGVGRHEKALIERALGAELSHHLGYAPGTAKPEATSNQRNGKFGKTVLTEDGPLRIAVPRDRAGFRSSRSRSKHERRFTGFDDKIIAMHARGMTVRDIQGFQAEQYGTEVSPEFISSVTDAVMTEVTAWPERWRPTRVRLRLKPRYWQSSHK
ncbi:mutator family transposase [Tahibacter aquaticus]|uniref:Mutator family transposase n=1 Tax=Tahibacter aquaticus TaxID=520092 RepID=A0A4R6YMS1_9GAMM|nr:mutator family transposase [Tahibacter aquaticus]